MKNLKDYVKMLEEAINEIKSLGFDVSIETNGKFMQVGEEINIRILEDFNEVNIFYS